MLEWITERLVALLGQAEAARKDQREIADKALSTISHALRETTLYFRQLEANPRDPDREAQLCHLWAAAAILVRHIDPEFAEICDRKADYWLNPENWDQQEILQHRIDLESVQARYRALLAPAGAWSKDGREGRGVN